MNKKNIFFALLLAFIFVLPSAQPLFAIDDGSSSAGSTNNPNGTGTSDNSGTTGQDDDDDGGDAGDVVEPDDTNS